MLEITTTTAGPRGRFVETSSRGVLVTLASKGARRFLTADIVAAADGKLLQLQEVGEDGDVAWHTAAARKVRGNVVSHFKKQNTGRLLTDNGKCHLAHSSRAEGSRKRRQGRYWSP